MLRTKGRQIGDDFNLLRNYEKMLGRITCGTFSTDGTKLIVGGFGGEARIYKFDESAKLATLGGHRGGIFAVAFHPNGSQVATGGFDGQVRIFDANSGQLIKSFVPVPVQAEVAAAK
jgi:WD40 repeat protein